MFSERFNDQERWREKDGDCRSKETRRGEERDLELSLIGLQGDVMLNLVFSFSQFSPEFPLSAQFWFQHQSIGSPWDPECRSIDACGVTTPFAPVAMDAMPSSRVDHAGRIFPEKLSEKIPSPTVNAHPNNLFVDTQSGSLRNGALESSTPVARTREGLTGEDTRSQRFTLRTLPAWIRSVEGYEEDEEHATANDRLLPSQPNDARVAQHNHSPYASSRPEFSQSHDFSLLEDTAPPDRESRWKTFSRTIQYPREYGREEKQVTADWMNQNLGDYAEPWRGKHLEGDSPEYPLHRSTRREVWFKRFHNSLLRSPMVPMILRLTVWCFSLSALALGGSIQHMSDEGHHPQGPSALMAIIVDAVALIYLVYITFDEYTSKPLGIRSPSAKARLILLDIFFIVFDSANLSLAFASLSEVTGACTEAEVNQELDPRNDGICVRQKALASVLLVALLAWLMTFAISVLRLVERVTQ